MTSRTTFLENHYANFSIFFFFFFNKFFLTIFSSIFIIFNDSLQKLKKDEVKRYKLKIDLKLALDFLYLFSHNMSLEISKKKSGRNSHGRPFF